VEEKKREERPPHEAKRTRQAGSTNAEEGTLQEAGMLRRTYEGREPLCLHTA